ncbi:hypothetical protein [Bradyrhizobium sp. 151]|uniref:hypothetical protein n=1 Tax=Bradyrhizobium sp. 151 TaxID=2782626 RepID=UPI001FF8B4E8|nr:hypothetical protein [Bradyrhizobium sp. 151]
MILDLGDWLRKQASFILFSPKEVMTFACCPCRCGKSNLAHLLARRPEGVFINPFKRGELGPDLFRACLRAKKEAARCGGLSSSVAVAGP